MEVDERHKLGKIITDYFYYPNSDQPAFDFVVGIDEAGRGPLAGPVAVGLVVVARHQIEACQQLLADWPLGRDSKKMTARARNHWYQTLLLARRQQALSFSRAFSSHRYIDNYGITAAVKRALNDCLRQSSILPDKTRLLLDGGLSAGDLYPHQQTIIKGDEQEIIIGLASVLAKVTRDRYMEKISRLYPQYQFDQHKGYGTKLHQQAINQWGLSDIHRQSFCRRLIPGL